jgi:ferredoxin
MTESLDHTRPLEIAAPADSTGPLTMLIPRIEATGAIPIVAPAPMTRRSRRGGKKLRVDWPACKGHGLCHELLPETVGLDEWGYPVIDPAPLRGARLDDAKKAVAACPTLALRLVEAISR